MKVFLKQLKMWMNRRKKMIKNSKLNKQVISASPLEIYPIIEKKIRQKLMIVQLKVKWCNHYNYNQQKKRKNPQI